MNNLGLILLVVLFVVVVLIYVLNNNTYTENFVAPIGYTNTILSGEIKNIGRARSDFAKINFLFRMNWRGDTKPLTCFAKGSIQDLGNGVVSDASIAPESIGSFELFIQKSFGDFISYSYALDWEEYE